MLVSSSIRTGLGHVNTAVMAGLNAGYSPAPSSLTRPSPHIPLTVLRVRLPVLGVLISQCLVPDDQHVFGILLLRRFGEVKTAREDGLAVDDHHLIMRNGMRGINLCGDALVGQEVGRGVFLGALALSRMTCTWTPR